MTTFYLIRHGLKQHRYEDKFLSEEGKKQGELTGLYLKDKNINAIYTSPLLRTRQTAEIINQSLNVPMYIEDRLRERMNYGDKPGETFEEFQKEWDKTVLDKEYVPTHGDSSRKTSERVKAVLDEITTEGNFVIVTHGGVIIDFLQTISNIAYLEVSECSITEVRREGDKYVLLRVNDVSHLLTPPL